MNKKFCVPVFRVLISLPMSENCLNTNSDRNKTIEMNIRTCCRILHLLLTLILSYPAAAQFAGVQYVNSDSLRIVRGYSHAVIFPELGIVKTSGLIGTDKTGKLINSSPREQIRQTFTNLRNVIEAAGSTIDAIDEIETFLTDSAYFKDYVLERIEFFKGRREPPISKTYYIKGLINPLALVEINVTATLPAKARSGKKLLYITAILEAKEGTADKLEELLANNVLASRNEKGCLQYDLYRGGKDGNTFILQEQWADKEAFDLHFRMPYMKELSKNIKELVKSSTINTMQKVER
jgi:quinol monooxygenase YgiN/enamine deaminase RidA (YjgF/YER057c/UK114 family)